MQLAKNNSVLQFLHPPAKADSPCALPQSDLSFPPWLRIVFRVLDQQGQPTSLSVGAEILRDAMVALLWPGRDRDDSNPRSVTGFAGRIAFLSRANSRGAFHSGVAPIFRVAVVFLVVLLSALSEIAEVAGVVMATYFAVGFECVHYDL